MEILGERYDEFWGLDEYDPYDPFDDEIDDYWRESAEQAGWFDSNGNWYPYDDADYDDIPDTYTPDIDTGFLIG